MTSLKRKRRWSQREETRLERALLTACTMALGLVFTAGAVQAKDIGDIDDADITSAVETELLLTDHVPFDPIDVETMDGVVTLSGTVKNLLAKERAAEVAKSTKGVRAVVNRLEVLPAYRETGEIRRDVENALLMDPATESYEVDVEVDDGMVTLTGGVESFQEKELAGKVAKSVRGVRDVANDIRIEYEGQRPDAEIEAEIERLLYWDVRVDDHLIEVAVRDGKATLKGTVGSVLEKSRALADAWKVAGVTDVNASGLEVELWARDESLRGDKYADLTDDEIADAVRDAFLYDPRVESFKPEVDVEEGVVTLRGSVDNLSAKMAAAEDARNVVGVWRVVNLLKVRPATEFDDSEIARRIKEAFSRDPYVDRYEITVSVLDGEANLYGTVDSLAEKRRASQIASRVRGVVSVDSYLRSVDAPAAQVKSDWEIEKDIENQLFWSPFVDEDEVTVSVEDGVATLAGKVDTWSERMAAQENAFEAGAEKVKNKLLVDYGPGAWKPQ